MKKQDLSLRRICELCQPMQLGKKPYSFLESILGQDLYAKHNIYKYLLLKAA